MLFLWEPPCPGVPRFAFSLGFNITLANIQWGTLFPLAYSNTFMVLGYTKYDVQIWTDCLQYTTDVGQVLVGLKVFHSSNWGALLLAAMIPCIVPHAEGFTEEQQLAALSATSYVQLAFPQPTVLPFGFPLLLGVWSRYQKVNLVFPRPLGKWAYIRQVRTRKAQAGKKKKISKAESSHATRKEPFFRASGRISLNCFPWLARKV